ncbi:hypothetical protein SAMN02910369_01342 [Lachnospiraceae bacterium NE2001]|nr:hypothetical protein SAMN02910369_01342 [Lachnospiraceae bacterium NE2001]
MKKILSKFKNRIKNSGSSLVLVIVALGFVGILAGALLTAVGYAYRLKLYDYNAKSNFYYLEQAMDEIYAGVGAQTMSSLLEAYEETKEQVIYFDPQEGIYRNKSNEFANSLFKNLFMEKFNPSSSLPTDFFYLSPTPQEDDALVENLSHMISNSTVKLDYSNLRLHKEIEDGNVTKVVIRNVKLVREADYSRSPAKGTFKQTIQTDIEISRPDFEVNFNADSVNTDNLFDYCMLADSGVEINEKEGSILNINGNVYAASDFYNKVYNDYSNSTKLTTTQNDHLNTLYNDLKKINGTDVDPTEYKLNKVSNYQYVESSRVHTLFNHYSVTNNLVDESNKSTDTATLYDYDGYNDRSKYSGFYVNGSTVNFVGDYFVVPGSISVMNSGVLNVIGYNNKKQEISPANVWADEIVLAGSTKSTTNTKGEKVTTGSKASFNANLYVKDDTQIESDYSEFDLTGGYYGYSNSSTSDDRIFVPTTKKVVNNESSLNIYQQYVGNSMNGSVENRGHYNSSSIIINGQHAKLDFSNTDIIYIAGRSYVELSQQQKDTRNVYYSNILDDKGNYIPLFYTTGDYEYDGLTNDYKTGESLSIKSNQIAYIPYNSPDKNSTNRKKYVLTDESNYNYVDAEGRTYKEAPVLPDSQCDQIIYFCDVPNDLLTLYLFQKYFGCDYTTTPGKRTYKTTYTIPVTYKEETVTNLDKPKVMYYIDFGYVLSNETYDKESITFKNGENKVDALTRSFIKDYFDYLDYYNVVVNYDDTKPETDAHKYAIAKTDTDLYADKDHFYDKQLQNVINYKYYDAGQISLNSNSYDDYDTSSNSYKSYTSGVLTKSGTKILKTTSDKDNKKEELGINYDVVLSKNSTLASPLLGSDSKDTSTAVQAQDYSKDFQKHYNYVKWSLMDMNPSDKGDASVIDTDVDVIDKILESDYKDVGEASITPLNKFMNFNKIYSASQGDPYLSTKDADGNITVKVATEISPDDFDLGDYKVWVSEGSVNVEADSNDNHEVTGIIIAKGDVYFKTDASDSDKSVHKFNGIIISGGKIFVNNNMTTNISSSELCRNIINSCIVKAKDYKSSDPVAQKQAAYACRVLSLFKSYEKYADLYTGDSYEYQAADNSTKDINTIDYSDVVRYNNWMRNVD